MKPRFWTRRRLAAWALIAALLLACGAALHDRRRTQRAVALIDRVDRLGGHVSTYREYSNWQQPLRQFGWLDGLVGRDAYNVALPKTAPTAEALREVAGLPNVRSLDLSDAAGVDDAALAAAAAAAPGLIALRLAGTAVTDAGIAALPALPDLMSANLDDTAVTDASVMALVRRRGMTLVDVGGTAATIVTGEGVGVAGPLRLGATVTITGAVVAREPPPVKSLDVFVEMCELAKARGYGYHLGAVVLKPQGGRQAFTLTVPVRAPRPGRYALQVSAHVKVPVLVVYRLHRQDVDVLPAAVDDASPKAP